jgi:hypothetical protein
MSRNNQNKTISCNSNGMVISYGDVNKHQFMRYETPSHIKNIQLNGTVKYQQIEKNTQFSPKQKDLYSKVVYGFKAYTPQEIAKMSEKTKKDVSVRYAKAQRILRNWKQDITFSNLDRFLLALFPKSPIIKQMVATTGHIDDVPKEDEISFKDLGIKQDQMANKLIEFGLLPQNFYQLV